MYTTVQPKLTTSFKRRAKELFRQAYQPSAPAGTIFLIKKQFPTFDQSSYIHWMTLIDNSNIIINKQERDARLADISISLREFNTLVDELVQESATKYGCVANGQDWLSYSAKISRKDAHGVMRQIGTININQDREIGCSWTRNQRPKLCKNLGQAFNILISMFSKCAA